MSLPASGPGLLRVATALAPDPAKVRVYGVHLKTGADQTVLDFDTTVPARERALAPLLESVPATGVEVRPLVFASRSPGRDVADLARVKHADVVVMGWHKPVVSNRILGGAVYHVMTQAPVDVAVYVERTFEPWTRILVPYRDAVHDDAALVAAGRIGAAIGIPVIVLRIIEGNDELASAASGLMERVKEGGRPSQDVEVKLVRSDDPLTSVVQQARFSEHDLIVIGVARAWGLTRSFIGAHHERLAHETNANLLILRKHIALATASEAHASAAERKSAVPDATADAE